MLPLQRYSFRKDAREIFWGEEVNNLKDGIRLQNRDIDLLIFLGRYKIISLDNTRYIYGTVTYQEKRIVNLVKHNYIRRLKHRYITLGNVNCIYLKKNRETS